jgi:hypothetical protein
MHEFVCFHIATQGTERITSIYCQRCTLPTWTVTLT